MTRVKTFKTTVFMVLGLLLGTNCVQLSAAVTYSMPLQGKEQVIGNLLEWSTAVETNSQMFMVERSTDGLEYENIGVIDAAGRSLDEKGYRFLDINATTTKAFYRLRQIDVDGSGSLSQSVLVNREIPNQFAVVSMSNTAVAKFFRCNLHASDDGLLNYTLRTLNKDLIQSGTLEMFFGLNELEINMSDEAIGTYVLTIQMDNEIESLVIRKTDEDVQVRNNVAIKDKNK